MRASIVSGLILIPIMVGFPLAYAAAPSLDSETTESLEPPTPLSQLGIGTHASRPPSNNAGPLPKSAAPDCDGAPPSSTGPVMALLSRLVRSSSAARGVQCPIPPLQDTSP